MKTLVHALRHHAANTGDHIACEWLEGDAPGPVHRLTYGELDRRARAVARGLLAAGLSDERVLLPFPPGLDFIVAFAGCLYAGAVPVPAPFPQNRRTTARTLAILRDCEPALCLTTEAWCSALRKRLSPPGGEADGPVVMAPEALPGSCGDDLLLPDIKPGRLAYLQYTSGTGGTAKGVMVTHANIIHNVAAMQIVTRQPADAPLVSWLPQYHDMQLVAILAQGLMIGARCVLMSPLNFIQSPVRWLRAISESRGQLSGGPNFAFEHCLRRISPEQLAGLDLSGWRVAFSSSERVNPDTLARFEQRFAAAGFDSRAWCPAYGLAEATVFVTGVTREQTAARKPHPTTGLTVVSCGRAMAGHQVAIVDMATGEALPAAQPGEVWVRGPSVAAGYWRRDEATRATFRNRMTGDTGASSWMRTGDLGFLDEDQNLYLTGRHKDLIIIRGLNHHPEDIESAIHGVHAALRGGEAAVFSVEDDRIGREQLVVVAELDRLHRHAPDADAIAEAVQIAINREHELALDHLILLRPGDLPKTTSGKIQRAVCRTRYLADTFNAVAVWHRPFA
jgi:acyl-CoA synthetase (AMP-forming)/AMP-acid ligase II